MAAAVAARLDEFQQPVRACAEHDVKIAAPANRHPDPSHRSEGTPIKAIARVIGLGGHIDTQDRVSRVA